MFLLVAKGDELGRRMQEAKLTVKERASKKNKKWHRAKIYVYMDWQESDSPVQIGVLHSEVY